MTKQEFLNKIKFLNLTIHRKRCTDNHLSGDRINIDNASLDHYLSQEWLVGEIDENDNLMIGDNEPSFEEADALIADLTRDFCKFKFGEYRWLFIQQKYELFKSKIANCDCINKGSYVAYLADDNDKPILIDYKQVPLRFIFNVANEILM